MEEGREWSIVNGRLPIVNEEKNSEEVGGTQERVNFVERTMLVAGGFAVVWERQTAEAVTTNLKRTRPLVLMVDWYKVS